MPIKGIEGNMHHLHNSEDSTLFECVLYFKRKSVNPMQVHVYLVGIQYPSIACSFMVAAHRNCFSRIVECTFSEDLKLLCQTAS